MCIHLRFEVFTAVTMKNVFFSDVSCHSDDGGATFLRNVVSYSSHTA
jgi:hypothetical protein